MGKGSRKGAIKKRSEKPIRTFDLGYYLIITDTKETEKRFFEGFSRKIPDFLKERVHIAVIPDIKTENLIQKACELRASEVQPRNTWIVLDRDQVKNFDQIVRDALANEFGCGWSNPCFEIFLLAYFGEMPTIDSSVKCCAHFSEVFEKKVGQEYQKSDERIYEKICQYGNEETALKIVKAKDKLYAKDDINKPSEMIPGTKVYELIEELNGKIVNAIKKEEERVKCFEYLKE